MQLQAAMSLPMRRVPGQPRGTVQRARLAEAHRAARSPRAVRFELEPGEPVDARAGAVGAAHRAAWHAVCRRVCESIRSLGPRSAACVARLLPLAEGADVYLLGTGLPSFWSVKNGRNAAHARIVRLDGERLDRSGALDQLAPPTRADAPSLLGDVAAAFQGRTEP